MIDHLILLLVIFVLGLTFSYSLMFELNIIKVFKLGVYCPFESFTTSTSYLSYNFKSAISFQTMLNVVLHLLSKRGFTFISFLSLVHSFLRFDLSKIVLVNVISYRIRYNIYIDFLKKLSNNIMFTIDLLFSVHVLIILSGIPEFRKFLLKPQHTLSELELFLIEIIHSQKVDQIIQYSLVIFRLKPTKTKFTFKIL